jgi:hypothetical protein
MNIFRPLILAVFVALLSACGGGNSSGTTSVAYVPSTAAVSFFQNQQQNTNTQSPDPSISVVATFNALPTGTIYPVIVENEAVFVSNKTVVRQSSSTVFTATLVPDVKRVPGVYQGVLTLLLCRTLLAQANIR